MNHHACPRSPVLVVGPLLDAEECARLIADSEKLGYTPLPVPEDASYPPPGAWCAVHDLALGEQIHRRLAQVSPGMNSERLEQPLVIHRFLPGERQLPSRGERGQDSDLQRRLCLVLFLTDGGAGEETVCYPFAGPVAIPPRRGMALLFPVALTCEDRPARTGNRYILRAEVLCRCSAATPERQAPPRAECPEG